MGILIILLRVVEVLVCLMLIGVILIQRSKGSGAGVSFGGGAGEAIFGAQMGNVLTKATVILGIVFLVNTVALSLLAAQRVVQRGDSLMVDETAKPVAAPAPAPSAFPDAAEPAAPAADALPDVAPAAPTAPAADALPDAPPAAPTAPAAP